ncbi:MAG: methyltransferase domain-containing protein [Actinomycetota bacterium]
MPEESAVLRRKLVADLQKAGRIKTAAVRSAFLAVPRELFVADHVRRGGLQAAYVDLPLVAKTDPKGAAISSSSQPAIMAVMLEALRLRRGLRVLEIGAGTGYNAALLSKIVGPTGRVTAIDIDAELVARARTALRRGGFSAQVVTGDGRGGWVKTAPYDRIIVTASTDSIPRAWWQQLAERGVIEVPFRLLEGFGSVQSIVVFERTNNGLRSIDSNPGSFMGLRSDADESAPLVHALRRITAFELSGTTTHVYGHLDGAPLGRAGRAGRERLVRLLLSEPRIRDVAAKSQSNALQTFLMLGLPRRSTVQYAGGRHFGVGVVSPDFDGVSVAVRRGNGGTHVRSFGSKSAERILDSLLSEWDSLGSPGDRDLEITVSFDGRPEAWRVLRRGDSHVGVNWRTTRRKRS